MFEGVSYNVIRSESATAFAGESIDLHDATVGLACAKADPALAVLAKRNIGQFWADTSKAPYKTLFNPLTSSIGLLRAVRAMRCIDQAIAGLIKALPKRSGKEYGVLVHGNRFIAAVVFGAMPSSVLSDQGTFEVNAELIAKNTKVTWEAVLAIVKSQYSDTLMATLFKNTEKCKAIFEVLKSQ